MAERRDVLEQGIAEVLPGKKVRVSFNEPEHVYVAVAQDDKYIAWVTIDPQSSDPLAIEVAASVLAREFANA